jgi:hypothetical protein
MADKIIFGLHVAVFMTGVLMPLLGDRKLLLFYSFLIPFIFFHWAVNDDTCALTQLEMMVTNEPKHRTFMGRFIGPIYKVSDDELGKMMKGLFFFLWVFAQWRLGLIKELLKSK